MAGSIGMNIGFGVKGSTPELIAEAARLACAFDFIVAKPQGFSYNVGSHGFLLSTGQRQRIALARAFLRKPSILVLDEATSGLDPATEDAVLRNLLESRVGLTTIIITHRQATAIRSERCIVLRHGRVSEDGNPLDVIGRSPEFQSSRLAVESISDASSMNSVI